MSALAGHFARRPAALWASQAALAGLVLLWLAATAGLRPLMLPDEGRYVGVAWEMMRSGDWLTPTLNGLPFFHKPPLFYWITAGAMSLFGPSELAARAASLLGGWLGAMALYTFARRWAGERMARTGLVALLAQPLFYLGGQFANLDMLVAGCISATVLSLADAALRQEQGLPHIRSLLAAYALAAAGVLAKGLIGFVVPALVLLLWLAIRGRWKGIFELMSLRGAALFSLIAAPWFVAMQQRFPQFADYFFVEQHFRRFAGSGFNNVQPFWFYPAVLLLFMAPWLFWLYRLAGSKLAVKTGDSPVRLLMAVWAAVVVVFFSLPQSKLLGYVLPAVPPLALLIADGLLARGEPSPRATRWWRAAAALGACLSVGAVLALTLHPTRSSRELAAALGALSSPGDRVFMLDAYYYDLPFYSRLPGTVTVVGDWPQGGAAQADNWRKELADAGRFAPQRAAATLVDAAQLPALLCSARSTSWLLGPAASASAYPFLSPANAVMTRRGVTLWRVTSPAAGTTGSLPCPASAAG